MRQKTNKSASERTVVCSNCAKEYQDFVAPSELKNNRTCSRLCFSEWMRKQNQRRSFLKKCESCGEEFRSQMKRVSRFCSMVCRNKGMVGRVISAETKRKISNGRVGVDNPYWKGGVHLYSSVHRRLKKAFGTPQKCENTDCPRKSFNFDWAKKREAPYEFLRENFYRLCRSCHRRYDYGLIEV